MRRQDGAEVSNFGEGYLFYVHQAGLDSNGNFYIGDVGGAGPRPVRGSKKSIQRFILMNKEP